MLLFSGHGEFETGLLFGKIRKCALQVVLRTSTVGLFRGEGRGVGVTGGGEG